MTAWNKVSDKPMPTDRPVLVRSKSAPIGVPTRDGWTVVIGQRGLGTEPGLWVVPGAFYPDAPRGRGPGSDHWTEWAEIPE